MAPRQELDACGIGFVADAQGRSSRAIVEAALNGLACVKHRGAVAADARTADGSGVLVPIPSAIFGENHGLAMLFVRGDDPRAQVEAAAKEEGIEVVDWREPPTDDDQLGEQAMQFKPRFLQAVLDHPTNDERAAFRMRKRIQATTDGTYVASCSFRTVVYKGLVAADALGDFWLDLKDDRFDAPFVVFHQRFSTNTTPTWERAQPFRMLCHNGEINALAGNVNRMRARATLGTDAAGLGPEKLFHPVLDASDSDSGKLDSAVELLVRGGRDIRHSVAMLVPEAWEGQRDLPRGVRGFFRYHACLTDPWDGPAGLVFSDGRRVGAALDRNGLRPLRWQVCDDGLVVCASEVGAVPVTGHGSVRRGRLGPGDMICVDPDRVAGNGAAAPTAAVQDDTDVKTWLARLQPYSQWARDGLLPADIGAPVEM